MPTMLPARIDSQVFSVDTPPMCTTASTSFSSAYICALSSSDASTISSPARRIAECLAVRQAQRLAIGLQSRPQFLAEIARGAGEQQAFVANR